MPQTPQKLNAAQPIIEEDGTMSQVFRSWAIAVTNAMPMVGTGSPEGLIEALQYSLYIDETIPLAPVQYRKMLPEIAGNRKLGWASL